MLREAMPNDYERWAQRKRDELKEEADRLNETLTSDLNDVVKASFLSLKTDLAESKIEVREMRNEIKELRNELKNEMQGIQEGIEMLQQHWQVQPTIVRRFDQPLFLPQQTNRQVHQQMHQQTNHTAIDRVEPTTQHQTTQRTAQQQTAQRRSHAPLQRPTQQPQLPQLNLRNTARFPVFPKKTPKTIRALTHEYISYSLSQFEKCRMTEWDRKVSMGYGRRKYMMNVVRAEAEKLQYGTYEHRILRAADVLDARRVTEGKSVSAYMNELKKTDTRVTKKPRNRR